MWPLLHSLEDLWLLGHLDRVQAEHVGRQHEHVSVVSSVLIFMMRKELQSRV
jgi:hypothetical protein